MYGWCCKCREKRPEEYKKLVGWEILFFPFHFTSIPLKQYEKCFQIGTSAHIVVGQSRTTTRWERCVSRSFFFPSASSRAVFWRWVIVNLFLPCLVLIWKVNLPCLVLSCFVLPCLALSCLVLPCLDVKSKLALPCLVSSCLVLPCLALSCLVFPCLASPRLALYCLVLGVRSNNRPTMQERQCVKCNRSSVWRGDHDSRFKKQTNKGRSNLFSRPYIIFLLLFINRLWSRRHNHHLVYSIDIKK